MIKCVGLDRLSELNKIFQVSTDIRHSSLHEIVSTVTFEWYPLCNLIMYRKWRIFVNIKMYSNWKFIHRSRIWNRHYVSKIKSKASYSFGDGMSHLPTSMLFQGMSHFYSSQHLQSTNPVRSTSEHGLYSPDWIRQHLWSNNLHTNAM